MHNSWQNLTLIEKKIKEIIIKKQLKSSPKIIVVTKKFALDKIKPLLENNHIHFGENKIQEAEEKWLLTKDLYKNIKLHMVGKLQTNKAKKAVKLFDYFHALDSFKLAAKISQYEKEFNKKIKIFIQVNLGEEDQKSGILLKNLNNFYTFCAKELSLNIIGLMCIPPANHEPADYFKILKLAADKLSLKDLSMGMSSDFETALLNGSTYLRLGTVIMGKRSVN